MSETIANGEKTTNVNISIATLDEADRITEERKSILGISSQNDESINGFISVVGDAIAQLVKAKGV